MSLIRSLLAALVLFLGVSGAFADTKWREFSPAAFAEAQASRATIVVHVHADWCPTCKAQQPILDELSGEAALRDVVLFKADFDGEKDFLRSQRIARQSTILVFKGADEVARSVAETNRSRLRGAMRGSW